MKPSVYIETSIPSFYFETRAEPEMVARRESTRHWWDFRRTQFEVLSSQAVLDELNRGDYPTKSAAIGLMREITLLPLVNEISTTVDIYLKNKLMPADKIDDATHLALASFYRCNYLLTWNSRHIANENKFHQIRVLNSRNGLFVPTILTPKQLCEEGSNERSDSRENLES